MEVRSENAESAELAGCQLEKPQERNSTNAHYSKADWWDLRFQSEESFDWYATYRELKGVFEMFCPPQSESELLMVGCGNSELSAELHEAGYHRIVNIDISGAAIAQMAERYEALELEWHTMDATSMTFESPRFSLAVDKGTLDAMMCGDNGAVALVAEVWRTLQPDGLFLLVSHSAARSATLNAAAAAHGGTWEYLELRRCRLSPQATLINTLRSHLGDRPLAEAFRDPELLKQAMEETRKVLRQMAFLEAFRMFRARKAKAIAVATSNSSDCAHAELPDKEMSSAISASDEDAAGAVAESMVDRDAKRQPFCWVYVLRKKVSLD